MAVREGEDRQLGGQSEKFLTLQEAARQLDISPDDVGSLIRAGKLTAFKLGGDILRFRSSDVEAIRSEREERSTISSDPSGIPRRSLAGKQSNAVDRFSDFLYFNDFYLIGLLVILTLLAIIFAL